MIHDGRGNAEVFCGFLKQLMLGATVPSHSVWKFGLSPLLGGGVRWSLWAADGLWVDAWSTRRVVHPAIHR
jgi:hypothetical protein